MLGIYLVLYESVSLMVTKPVPCHLGLLVTMATEAADPRSAAQAGYPGVGTRMLLIYWLLF